MKSVNLAKWNIYAVALQDLTFFTFSYLKATTNYEDTNKDNPIYNEAPIDEFDNDVSMFTDARRYVHPTSTTENNRSSALHNMLGVCRAFQKGKSERDVKLALNDFKAAFVAQNIKAGVSILP